MIDPVLLLAFLPVGLALNLTPGADMMLCLGQGMKVGPRAAWAASAGISTGSLIHSAVAGLGLAALLEAYPAAFEAIRWAGVAYLLWLALQLLRGGGEADVPPLASKAFRTGLIVNLSNPKVALFVLALVPQFLAPGAAVFLQFMVYGAMLAVGGFVINGLVGQFAGSFGRRLTGGGRVLDRVTGAIFAGLALRLALLERT